METKRDDLKQNDYNIVVVVVVFVMEATLLLEGVFVTGDSAVNQMRLVAQADLISLIREKQMVRKCIDHCSSKDCRKGVPVGYSLVALPADLNSVMAWPVGHNGAQ